MGLKINTDTTQEVAEVVSELVDTTQQVNTTSSSPYWTTAKLKYFEENLKEGLLEPYTLKRLAEENNMNYGSLRQVSWAEGWNKELEVLRAKKEAALKDRLLNMQVMADTDIRLRQAQIARIAQAKALQHLQSIDPTKMKTSDAITLLNLGLIEERKALGMATTPAEMPSEPVKPGQKDKKSVMDDAMKLIEGLSKEQNEQGMKDVN